MAFSFRMQARWKSYTHNVSLKLGMRQNSLGFNFYCKIKLSYKEFKICIDIRGYLHLEFWYQSNKKQQCHYMSFPGNMDAGESGDIIVTDLPEFSSNTSLNGSKHQPGFTTNTKASDNNTSSSDWACHLLISGVFSSFHKSRGAVEPL